MIVEHLQKSYSIINNNNNNMNALLLIAFVVPVSLKLQYFNFLLKKHSNFKVTQNFGTVSLHLILH